MTDLQPRTKQEMNLSLRLQSLPSPSLLRNEADSCESLATPACIGCTARLLSHLVHRPQKQRAISRETPSTTP